MLGYLWALGWTLIIECSIAIAWPRRNLRLLTAVVLVNLVTHPLFGLSLYLARSAGWTVTTPMILVAEFVIALSEGAMLSFALPARSRREMFLLALSMNAASYLASFVL